MAIRASYWVFGFKFRIVMEGKSLLETLSSFGIHLEVDTGLNKTTYSCSYPCGAKWSKDRVKESNVVPVTITFGAFLELRDWVSTSLSGYWAFGVCQRNLKNKIRHIYFRTKISYIPLYFSFFEENIGWTL